MKSIETAIRPRPVKELLNEVRKMRTSSNEKNKFDEEHKTKLDSSCKDINLRTGECIFELNRMRRKRNRDTLFFLLQTCK